jgi:hypothetical protein
MRFVYGVELQLREISLSFRVSWGCFSFFFFLSSFLCWAHMGWRGGGGVFISKSSISVVSSFCFLFLSISVFFNASLSLCGFEIDVILSLHICLSF